MRLIANIAQAEPLGMGRSSSLAQLTATDAGWLLSLVLHVSDKRLVGGYLSPASVEPVGGTAVHARLTALADRLASEGADASVVGSHVYMAARVLELQFRRRLPAEQSVLSSKQLRIATGMLGSELHRVIHTQAVATACGLSEGHLRRAFKTCTGLSPSKWRQEKRLELCRTQLVQTDESLAEVARQAGFVVQSHFSRVFTRTTGMSPSEWRRVFQSAARAGAHVLEDVAQAASLRPDSGATP